MVRNDELNNDNTANKRSSSPVPTCSSIPTQQSHNNKSAEVLSNVTIVSTGRAKMTSTPNQINSSHSTSNHKSEVSLFERPERRMQHHYDFNQFGSNSLATEFKNSNHSLPSQKSLPLFEIFNKQKSLSNEDVAPKEQIASKHLAYIKNNTASDYINTLLKKYEYLK